MSFQDKKVRKKRRWGKVFEYTSFERELVVGEQYDELLNELKEEYSKRKNFVITPQELAVKRGIRVSVAKRVLNDLEEQGITKKAVSSQRLKLYTSI